MCSYMDGRRMSTPISPRGCLVYIICIMAMCIAVVVAYTLLANK